MKFLTYKNAFIEVTHHYYSDVSNFSGRKDMLKRKVFSISYFILLCSLLCLLFNACNGDNVTKIEEIEEFNITITSPHGVPLDYVWPQLISWETDYTGSKILFFEIGIREANGNLIVAGDTNELQFNFNCIYESLEEYTVTVYGYETINDELTLCDEASREFTAGVDPSTPLEMVLIQEDFFLMGDYNIEGEDNELPVHNVRIFNYWVSTTEISMLEYSSVVGDNPSNSGGPEYPAYHVSWVNAITYCNLKSEFCGFTPCYNLETGECNYNADGYRLPTEAEWEYAARGGTSWVDSLRYSGCNETDLLTDFAWYAGNSGWFSHYVATRQPNQLEIYDMSGNTWEWCNDWFDEDYYSLCPVSYPKGPENGTEKVCRGGSYYYSEYQCRVAFRGYFEPTFESHNVGFRVVRKAEY